MEGAARVLGDEFEERIPPWIIGEMKNLVANLLQFLRVDCPERLGHGFDAVFRQIFKIEFF